MDEYVRFRAYGNQLIDVHLRLREMLEDLREGFVPEPEPELGLHCLALCAAVSRHHTAEDTHVFPILAARHPELRDFLAALERDHVVIAEMLTRLAAWARGPAGPHERIGPDGRAELDGLAAVLETHFLGEEKRLAKVLDALEPTDGIIF